MFLTKTTLAPINYGATHCKCISRTPRFDSYNEVYTNEGKYTSLYDGTVGPIQQRLQAGKSGGSALCVHIPAAWKCAVVTLLTQTCYHLLENMLPFMKKTLWNILIKSKYTLFIAIHFQ